MSFPWFKPVSPWEKEQEERAVAEAMARYIEVVILGRAAPAARAALQEVHE